MPPEPERRAFCTSLRWRLLCSPPLWRFSRLVYFREDTQAQAQPDSAEIFLPTAVRSASRAAAIISSFGLAAAFILLGRHKQQKQAT
jgi:hypothetical protein